MRKCALPGKKKLQLPHGGKKNITSTSQNGRDQPPSPSPTY